MTEFLAILAASSAVASWLQIAIMWRQQRPLPPVAPEPYPKAERRPQ